MGVAESIEMLANLQKDCSPSASVAKRDYYYYYYYRSTRNRSKLPTEPMECLHGTSPSSILHRIGKTREKNWEKDEKCISLPCGQVISGGLDYMTSPIVPIGSGSDQETANWIWRRRRPVGVDLPRFLPDEPKIVS